MKLGHATRDPAAHRIADEVRTIDALLIEHGDDVTGAFRPCVAVRLDRRIALAVAEAVDADRAITPIDERARVVLPGLLAAGPAMLHGDRRTIFRTIDAIRDPVAPVQGEASGFCCHCRSSTSRLRASLAT